MSAELCPTCRHIHCTRDVVAVGRFDATDVRGYRNLASIVLHPTRTAAEAALCAARTTPTTNPAAAATRAELTAEQED